MTKHFFIVGLPRSRTAWFANLFTTEQTYCFHEPTIHGSFDKTFSTVDRKYVGASEPNPIFVEPLLEPYKQSPLVIIEKPFWRSLYSAINACEMYDGDGLRAAFQVQVESQRALDRIKKDWPKDLLLVEPFKDCDVRKIWQHCCPDVKIDEDRLNLLNKLRVNVLYRNLSEMMEVHKL